MHTSTSAGVVLLGLLCAGAARGQTYQFMTYDIPGTSGTLLYDANASEAAGDTIDATGILHCFTATAAGHHALVDPQASQSSCYGINTSGAIAGSYPFGGFSNGFLYSGGVFSDVIMPTATAGTVATAVNDLGQVAGYFADNVGSHAFFKDAAGYHTIDAPGATFTLGIGLNNGGLIALQSGDAAGTPHSYVYHAGQFREVMVPGAMATYVHEVNNHSQVAIAWLDAGGVSHGAVYDAVRNIYTTVDDPGKASTSILGINDQQALVGDFTAPGSSSKQGFIATGSVP